MSWNVEGLTYLKKTSEDFTKIISNYDIICLYETWTGKNSKITVDGYKAIHSYRRFQHRRAKRASGGIIIYIKDSMKNGVKLVRNDIDSIVWLKLDKQFFCSKYYYSHPSMLKFVQLLNSSGNTLKRLSIYITKAFAARNVAFNDILEQ